MLVRVAEVSVFAPVSYKGAVITPFCKVLPLNWAVESIGPLSEEFIGFNRNTGILVSNNFFLLLNVLPAFVDTRFSLATSSLLSVKSSLSADSIVGKQASAEYLRVAEVDAQALHMWLPILD